MPLIWQSIVQGLNKSSPDLSGNCMDEFTNNSLKIQKLEALQRKTKKEKEIYAKQIRFLKQETHLFPKAWQTLQSSFAHSFPKPRINKMVIFKAVPLSLF